MMKKLVVNDNCIGCGMCAAIDEEHFEMDGVSTPVSQENLESEALDNAINSCPVNAISIEEVEEAAA